MCIRPHFIAVTTNIMHIKRIICWWQFSCIRSALSTLFRCRAASDVLEMLSHFHENQVFCNRCLLWLLFQKIYGLIDVVHHVNDIEMCEWKAASLSLPVSSLPIYGGDMSINVTAAIKHLMLLLMFYCIRFEDTTRQWIFYPLHFMYLWQWTREFPKTQFHFIYASEKEKKKWKVCSLLFHSKSAARKIKPFPNSKTFLIAGFSRWMHATRANYTQIDILRAQQKTNAGNDEYQRVCCIRCI